MKLRDIEALIAQKKQEEEKEAAEAAAATAMSAKNPAVLSVEEETPVIVVPDEDRPERPPLLPEPAEKPAEQARGSGSSVFEYVTGNDALTPKEFSRLIKIFKDAAEDYYCTLFVNIPEVFARDGNAVIELPAFIGINLEFGEDLWQACSEISVFFTSDRGSAMGKFEKSVPKSLKFIWDTERNNAFDAVPDVLQDFARKQGNGSAFTIVPVV